MIADQKFPRTHRLGGRGTFQRIRDAGRRVTSGPLAAWSKPNDKSFSRLGISIGRMVGNAATRNRIKRHLREAFRKLPPASLALRPGGEEDYFASASSCGIDLVVQIRPHEPAAFDQYQRWWSQLLDRLN